jgi:hypothetical protein
MSEYNGWKNYETWLVNVWFSDNYNEYFLERFRDGELLEPVTWDMVRSYVEDWVDNDINTENGFIADLVNGAMREVDWRELASHVEEMLKYEMEAA